jgi:Helix-turn-helix
MIPFQTTPSQRVCLASIVVAMHSQGLDLAFVDHASEIARNDQGVFDLMAMWKASENSEERAAIIADIQDLVDDYEAAPSTPTQRPYIRFDQLPAIAKSVMADKVKLRALIDRHGGVSAVALKAGIPQPSLSRMLAAPSIPRRTTLYKIANALGLPESDIVSDWTR